MNAIPPFMQGWLASEQASHDRVETKRLYIDLCDGNLYDGILFGRLMYWMPRAVIERDGFVWVAKSYADWWGEVRINEHTARDVVKRLVATGMVAKKLWKFNGAPTLHLRIDFVAVQRRMLDLGLLQNGFDGKPQIESTADPKTITDLTTEEEYSKEYSAEAAATHSEKEGLKSRRAKSDRDEIASRLIGFFEKKAKVRRPTRGSTIGTRWAAPLLDLYYTFYVGMRQEPDGNKFVLDADVGAAVCRRIELDIEYAKSEGLTFKDPASFEFRWNRTYDELAEPQSYSVLGA